MNHRRCSRFSPRDKTLMTGRQGVAGELSTTAEIRQTSDHILRARCPAHLKRQVRRPAAHRNPMCSAENRCFLCDLTVVRAGFGATSRHARPTMYVGVLAAARDDRRRPTLLFAVSGGASLPVAVIDRFAQTFGADIYEGYGLSETSPVATFNQRVFGRKPRNRGPADLGHGRGDRRARDRGPHRTVAHRGDRRGGDAGDTTSSPAIWTIRRPPRRSWWTAGSGRVTWAVRTPTASSRSSTARGN